MFMVDHGVLQNSLSNILSSCIGMISVEYKKDSNNFKVYIGSRKPPHTDRDWLKCLFVANGGNASCLNKILTKRDKSNEACFTVADKVRS